MALSATYIRNIFFILEVPYTTSYNTVNEMGVLSAATDVSGASQGAAKTAILASIAALGADEETELNTLCARWAVLGTTSINMQGGGVGSVQGVTFDYDKERAIIRERVKYILPYYKLHEVFAKRMGGNSNSVSIGVIR